MSAASRHADVGHDWCKSWKLLACNSICLLPAQIWYAAVADTAPTPTSQPSELPPSCKSDTVDTAIPKHTMTIDATTCAHTASFTVQATERPGVSVHAVSGSHLRTLPLAKENCLESKHGRCNGYLADLVEAYGVEPEIEIVQDYIAHVCDGQRSCTAHWQVLRCENSEVAENLQPDHGDDCVYESKSGQEVKGKSRENELVGENDAGCRQYVEYAICEGLNKGCAHSSTSR